MYQTRRQLKNRILELETDLNREKMVNKLRDENGLAKGVGQLCKSCSHAVFLDDAFGHKQFIGCDVSAICKNFDNSSTRKISNQ